MACNMRPRENKCDEHSYPVNLDKVLFFKPAFKPDFDCKYKWRIEFYFSENHKTTWAYELKSDRDEDIKALSSSF